jgi:hypothetical protein
MEKIKDLKEYPESFLTDVTDKEIDNATANTKLTSMTFEDPKSENAEKTENGEPKKEGAGRLQLEGLVDGRLMLDIVDGLLAAIVVWIVALFLYEVKRKDMRLTETEKDILDPIVDKCLATIDWNFENAWVLLGVSLLFIYAGKAVDSAVKKPKKAKQPGTGGKINQTADVVDLDPDNEPDLNKLKQQQFEGERSHVPADMVTDYGKNQPPKELSYTPDELREMATRRKESVPRLKKKLAAGNAKKGIKTIFLNRER